MASINPQQYPQCYDDILSPTIQSSLLDWMNQQQHWIDIYEKQRHCGVKELEVSAARFQKQTSDMIRGVKSWLADIGVYAGYNLAGYRNKWTLVTYDTAVLQLEWEAQCVDYYD